jgi:RNA polymerase sigma factor (sigma-70 family)
VPLRLERFGLGVGALRLLGDDRLAQMAAAGNANAFAAIYERHRQGIYRYCRTILGTEEDASDALQNTMIGAMNALPGERRTISLRAWLYRIAHNEAISIVRRRAPAAAVSTGEESNRHEVSPETPARAVENRERLRELIADVATLPARQRSALVMRELAGLPYSEIGGALGLTAGAAKQAVYEARMALQEAASGREMRCEDVMRSISTADGRTLRNRRLQSHLSGCAVCSVPARGKPASPATAAV